MFVVSIGSMITVRMGTEVSKLAIGSEAVGVCGVDDGVGVGGATVAVAVAVAVGEAVGVGDGVGGTPVMVMRPLF